LTSNGRTTRYSMSDRGRELALTLEEVEEILRSCGPEVVLVGGQALAIWAQRYRITPPEALSDAVTRDADFLGSAKSARELSVALGPGWRYWKPGADDSTPQTAKLSK